MKSQNLFQKKNEKAELNITLSTSEFEIFEQGIYADSMDEKWNIFLIGNHMYWARSWTDKCIFKIGFERQNEKVDLKKIYVTRDPNEYHSSDLQNDIKLFKRMLGFYMKRKQ